MAHAVIIGTVTPPEAMDVSMRGQDEDRVRGFAAFADVEPAVLDGLLEHSFVQTLPKGAVLFEQGDEARFLHVILAGRLGLMARSDSDEETVVEFFAAGDAVIAPAIILDMPYLMSGRVLEEARILMMPAARFRAALAESHALTAAMMRELARHWRLLVRQIKDLKLRSAPQRVGCYLLTLADGSEGAAAIVLPEERRMLAARLGMTPESLSRAFAQLREQGVGGRGREVEIADVGRLRAFCAYDDLA